MRLIKIIQFLILLTSISLLSQERKIVWEENFNGDNLELQSWNFEIGDGCPELCGWGNNERQVYTKINHRLSNGRLYIEA